MNKWVSFFLVVNCFSFSSGMASVKAKDVEQTVAEINGEKILKADFDQAFNQNSLFLSNDIVTHEKVLNDLINRKLGINKAKKSALEKDPTVQRKIEDILYHAQISKDLEPILSKIEVKDSDVEEYYKDNKEYRTAHILFRTRPVPSDEEQDAALAQALIVYHKAKNNPEKFTEFANQYTQSTTAPVGGDLGFQPPPRLAPEYFQAIKGKELGYISPPVKTQFGFHIIKVLAIKDYKHLNLGLYKKIIYDKKRDDLIAKYFSELRKPASIKIFKENLE